MSNLARSNGGSTSSRLAKKKKEVATEPPQAEPIETSAEQDLTDVAIVAADAPFAKAIETFNQRYTQNLKQFGTHITGVQQTTSNALIGQILNAYGLTEEEIYGSTLPSAPEPPTD